MLNSYDTLKGLGFTDLGRCSACGGSVHKWQKDNTVIYLKPKTHIFRIKEGNNYVTDWKKLSQLHEIVEAYISKEAQSN
jgi:hypothetical protein